MSILYSKSDRRILPRWRIAKKAAANADFHLLKPENKPSRVQDSFLSKAIEDFKAERTIGNAAELLSNALLVANKVEIENAANFIIGIAAEAPSALVAVAQATLSGIPLPQIHYEKQVISTKQLLKLNPDNPMLWSDLARHHATFGNSKRARRCMAVALQLAPNHRWILRTVARFLVHQNDPVAAQKLIAGHPRTRQDPWLLAAELACAHVAGRPPKLWRQANHILKAKAFAPAHLSELATAVAMMELESGDARKARRNIQIGLVTPTENTLAQILWAKANKHLKGFDLDQSVSNSVEAYEADFRIHYQQGDLLRALDAAKTWNDDEPFRARPREEIAFIASLLDDYALVEEQSIAAMKLRGARDFTLEMNIIFAQLSAQKYDLQKAEEIEEKLTKAIDRDGPKAYHATANLALLKYRYGNPLHGKALYQIAINAALTNQHHDAAALAAIFAAREAILANDEEAMSILRQATALNHGKNNTACDFYLKKIVALSESPEKVCEILSPTSAQRFLPDRKKDYSFRLEKQSGKTTAVFSKR